MTWDYIVVGAGSAGCAAAYELGRSGRNRVLLVEAGGSNCSIAVKIPGLVVKATQKFDWGYVAESDESRGGRIEKWTRGRVLGGTSSINGMMFVRGAPHDFDGWAQLGMQDWAYRNVLPLYRDMETSDQPGPLRGHQGPLHVRTVAGVAHPLSDTFVEAAVSAGHVFNPDYNGASQEGVSYAQLSQKKGLRCSSADAFLKGLSKKRNVVIRLNTQVERIHIRHGMATGVSCLSRGRREFIDGARIIMCCGSIATPKVLMLSGVGDATALKALGIDSVVHLPQVGKSLQDHPLVRLVFKSRVQSNNLTGGIRQRLAIARDFLLHRQGPLSTTFEAAAFLRTQGDEVQPDIQLHFMPYGYLGLDASSPFPDYPAVSVLVNKNYPRSRGQVDLASADPREPPIIRANLLGEGADVQTLVQGIQLVRRIMSCRAMLDVLGEEVMPGPAQKSDADLQGYVRRNTEVAYHPIGTCRMGVDADAVVSPELKVNGVENLWVADASIMPVHISGNINATCMMIGSKIGRQLAAV